MFLSRILCPDGRIALALRQGSEAALVRGDGALGPLIAQARGAGMSLSQAILGRGLGEPLDIDNLLAQGRVLAPLPAGPVTLLPASPGDDGLPLSLAPPGQTLCPSVPSALEGGVAAVFVADAAGRPDPVGWVQTHLARVGGPQGWLALCCGPELCLDDGPVAVAGHVRLTQDDRTLASFTLPDPAATAPAPAVPPMPPGTVVIQRRTRWLLRPSPGGPSSVLHSRIAGLGLALWNRLGEEAAAVAATTPAGGQMRRQT